MVRQQLIKILTTSETLINIDWDAHKVSLISNKVLDSKLIDEKNETMNPMTYQFSSNEIKWGIISFGRKHALISIYAPGEKINVSINGLISEAKWDKSQVRVNGLTKTFNELNTFYNNNLEAVLFKIGYSPEENTLYFTEI